MVNADADAKTMVAANTETTAGPDAETTGGAEARWDEVTATAVAAAQAAGEAGHAHTAVALLDLQTGVLYGAGDIDETYASASVMKVFIAARLLVDGHADTPRVRDLMWRMITLSDDVAADELYNLAGAENLVPWIADHYGISGLAPTNRPGWWGLTRITARSMVDFYAAVAADPVVAPWLMDAMAQTESVGADGFYQHFGLPSAAASWRVKQGWMCCLEGFTRMHSTGYIDNDRYAVALLAAGPPSMYTDGGPQTLTAMARALLPNGTVPTSA
ncbi:MAG: serine hydrolase [Micromonosporaceae bacterium]|nr:serine hydrolase [Micromonosporaceae bacterium]